MQIDHHFQSSLSSPVDRGIDVRSGPLCIRTPRLDIAPITYRNAHQIEAGILDLPKVVKRHEAVPVRFEDRGTLVLSDRLAQSPLIDDGIVGSAVTLEDGWCNKPISVNVMKQTSCWVATHDSRTSQPPRLTPRTLSLLPQLNATRRSWRSLVGVSIDIITSEC